jgi:hypothetical protein
MDARKQPTTPVFVTLDEFLVNLPSRGGEHFLSTTMVLRVADGKTEGKVKDFLPLIRDRVLTVLSSRPMEQLSTVEGKDLMARECALVINAIIEPQLTAIYVLQQDATTADLRNLERIGVMTPGGRAYGGTSAGERVGDAVGAAENGFLSSPRPYDEFKETDPRNPMLGPVKVTEGFESLLRADPAPFGDEEGNVPYGSYPRDQARAESQGEVRDFVYRAERDTGSNEFQRCGPNLDEKTDSFKYYTD